MIHSYLLLRQDPLNYYRLSLNFADNASNSVVRLSMELPANLAFACDSILKSSNVGIFSPPVFCIKKERIKRSLNIMLVFKQPMEKQNIHKRRENPVFFPTCSYSKYFIHIFSSHSSFLWRQSYIIKSFKKTHTITPFALIISLNKYKVKAG